MRARKLERIGGDEAGARGARDALRLERARGVRRGLHGLLAEFDARHLTAVAEHMQTLRRHAPVALGDGK